MSNFGTLRDGNFPYSKGFKTSYTIGKKIGEGGYSIVKKVMLKKNHKDTFAAKIIAKRALCPRSRCALHEEIKILQALDHPNIITFHQAFEGKSQYYLVTELMVGGELSDHITSKTSKFHESDVRHIMKTLFEAINYCHGRGIVHRDLKPENILLVNKKNKREVKIADFGFARKISEDSLLTLCGTPMYIAPEILSGTPYGTKVDMWSLGVLAYILSTGKFPFNSLNNDELYYDSMRGRFKNNTSSWKAVSLGAKDVVTSLLVVTPSARLSAKQVIGLPWFVESDRPLSSSTNNMKFKSKTATQKLRCAVLTAIFTNTLISAI